MHHFDFDGRVVAVTGGGSGIGRETARQFSEHGADVVVADVDDENGQETVDELEGDGRYVHTDVASLDQVRNMVDTAIDEFGRLDFAINNAGIGGPDSHAGDLEEEEWRQVVNINLDGVWRSMKAELEVMTEQEDGGVIVNMSSILGHVAFETASAYVAAKHGVLGLTKTAAWEYAEQNIRVNAVCPGFIETPLLEAGGIEGEVREHIESLHSQKRLGRPEEVADGVMWLCSDGASFTNGESLTIDSGYIAR